MTQLPGFSAAESASAWACTPPDVSRLFLPPRKSLQLTEPRESVIEKVTILVVPVLVSFMSKAVTSPTTVRRPMSSVISFIGTAGSWMFFPIRASEGAARCAALFSLGRDSASSASARWRSSAMRWMRFSSSPVTSMRAVARMPNRSYSFSARIRSTLRAFRKAAPSSEETHTVNTPSSSFQPLPFQSMKCMQPGLSCLTSDFISEDAMEMSSSTLSRRAGYSKQTLTRTAGKAEAIRRSTRAYWASLRIASLRKRTRISPVFWEMRTRDRTRLSASAPSSRAIRSFQSSDMGVPFPIGWVVTRYNSRYRSLTVFPVTCSGISANTSVPGPEWATSSSM